MSNIIIKSVPIDSTLYIEARNFAKGIYNKKWSTNILEMHDEYSHALVAILNNKIIGNLNFSYKSDARTLSSEKFIYNEYWVNEFPNINRNEVVEISGLSVCDKESGSLRIRTLSALVTYAHIIGISKGKKLFTTIQRPELMRTLTEHMKLPYQLSKNKFLFKEMPNDNYWKGKILPSVYYCRLDSNLLIFEIIKKIEKQMIKGISIS